MKLSPNRHEVEYGILYSIVPCSPTHSWIKVRKYHGENGRNVSISMFRVRSKIIRHLKVNDQVSLFGYKKVAPHSEVVYFDRVPYVSREA